MFSYTKKKLAKEIIKSISLFYPNSVAKYEAADDQVVVKSKGTDDDFTAKIYLQNLFQQCKGLSRAQRQERINQTVSENLVREERSIDDRIQHLRLRARTPEIIAYQKAMLAADGISFSATTFGSQGMMVELVEDSKTQVAGVSEEALQELGLNKEEAFKIAVAAHVRESNSDSWEPVENIWISKYQDDYDFARLIAAGTNVMLPFEISDVVLFAPTHSDCIISNKHDSDTLQRMIDVGEKLSGEDRVLSKRLWTMNVAGQWVHYENNQNADTARIVKLQQVLDDSLNYQDQKTALDSQHEKTGKDIYVANYMGLQNKVGDIISNCTYTIDLPTLLPKTDWVSIYDHSTDEVWGEARWDDFIAAIQGSYTEMTDFPPVRLAILNLLSEQQKTQLKQATQIAKL